MRIKIILETDSSGPKKDSSDSIEDLHNVLLGYIPRSSKTISFRISYHTSKDNLLTKHDYHV